MELPFINHSLNIGAGMDRMNGHIRSLKLRYHLLTK